MQKGATLAKAKDCKCALCANNTDFIVEDFLVDEIRASNAVIFAGAGISTENPNSAPHSLYTELTIACGLTEKTLGFPDLAELFSEQPDGMFKLVKLIQDRFDYINSFSDLRSQSTRFFEELSTMPYLRDFVTTNWDRYFEEVCRAKPFVYDADMRFWNVPDRKVLKIHGTIDDYSSMVATRNDYNKCSKRLRTSLVGSKLKDILSNKTCVFIGYSMQDDDFKEIFEFVQGSLGVFEKTHYVVSPFIDQKDLPKNLRAIRTDGTFFLKSIKDHFCSSFGYVEDDTFNTVMEDLLDVQDAHIDLWNKYSVNEHPQILLSAMYQDGLIHGFQMAMDMKNTGRYSCPDYLESKIDAYELKVNSYLEKEDYIEAAYFRGYQNTFISILSSIEAEFALPPHYFFAETGEIDSDEFEKLLSEFPKLHEASFAQCRKKVESMPADGCLVLDHCAWG